MKDVAAALLYPGVHAALLGLRRRSSWLKDASAAPRRYTRPERGQRMRRSSGSLTNACGEG
jgi:hypothetical protein